MKTLSINKLIKYLNTIVEHNIQSSLMIWGAPGIGKSSVVQAVAKQNDLELIDLRISQLAPTDLRGLPVPNDKTASWIPPDFLPTEGKGILFLDEINMAPPAVQGIAQQLILDKTRYKNSIKCKNDLKTFAAVFDMPAPLANRFIHLEVKTSINEFKTYSLVKNLDDRIISFLNFRPKYLHKIDKNSPSWPSPRSWEISNTLLKAGLDVDPAIGKPCATEFRSFCKVYKNLPNIEPILNGKSQPNFPKDLSAKYALTTALTVRAKTVKEVKHAFLYIEKKGGMEWLTQCTHDVAKIWMSKSKSKDLIDMLIANDRLMVVAEKVQKLLAA